MTEPPLNPNLKFSAEETETASKQTSRQSKRAMSRVAGAHSRVVAYLPSLRTILQRLRATSSKPSSLTSSLTHTNTTGTTDTATDTPSLETISDPDLIAVLAHPKLPLPGEMGVATLTPSATPSTTSTTPSDEHASAVVASISTETNCPTVECLVQECPERLHSGFMLLFPGVSVISNQLTIITLSENTVNDMTGWSSAIEEEREQLLEHFIDSSKEICARLSAAGFWADFIDPSSGRAFYTTAYSNATLFETDDRFRHLGFDILDLGCCKCIRHPLWGSHTFVGTIFTDAPTNSPAIQRVMQL